MYVHTYIKKSVWCAFSFSRHSFELLYTLFFTKPSTSHSFICNLIQTHVYIETILILVSRALKSNRFATVHFVLSFLRNHLIVLCVSTLLSIKYTYIHTYRYKKLERENIFREFYVSFVWFLIEDCPNRTLDFCFLLLDV